MSMLPSSEKIWLLTSWTNVWRFANRFYFKMQLEKNVCKEFYQGFDHLQMTAFIHHSADVGCWNTHKALGMFLTL